MIEYKKGNLLDVTEGIIVHGCNAQGVMGSGVAKAIREKYPECFSYYKYEYDNFTLVLGTVVWYDCPLHSGLPMQSHKNSTARIVGM